MQLEMIVCGFGDIYAEFFNAIARSLGNDSYTSLVRVSVLLSGFSVLASFIFSRDIFSIIKWFFIFYIIIYIFFLPKITLNITDRIGNKPYPVANVPLGLGIIASVSTRLSDGLTRLTEMNFSLPDGLKYQQTGMIFSAQLMKASTQFEITDPRMESNMQSFVQQCVFYDLFFKKYTLKDLVSSADIWEFLQHQKQSPVRGFIYSEIDNNSTFKTCKEAFPLLTAEWRKVLEEAKGQYRGRLFSQQRLPGDPFAKYLRVSYSFLTKLAEIQADKIMQQTMMANAIERGAIDLGAKVDANAALKSYAYVRAQSQKRMTNQTVAEMAAYWLPLIKVCLELILYGAFIFVILIAIFPFGATTLKTYLYTLFWIQLWPPLFAIFNLLISYHAQTEIASTINGGVSMQSLSSLSQMTSDLIGLAGYMSLSVPAIAGGLLWGMHNAFAQVSQYVGGVAQSASTQAASEAVSGNFSLGNTSIANHNAFNTSTNKLDTNLKVATGAGSLQQSDGTQLAHMPDGREVVNMQGTISSIGTQIDLSEAYRSSLAKSSNHAESAAKQSAHNYSHSLTTVARTINDIGHHVNQSEGSGENWNIQASSAVSKAFGEVHKANNELAKRFGLTYDQASNLSASLYGSGGAQVGGKWLGIGISGNLGGSRTGTHSDTVLNNKALTEAKSILSDHHYAENVDMLSRATQDKNYRINHEQGARLTDDINVSLDRADGARHEISANLQKIDSYSKAASYVKEHGANVRDNLSQEFVEFIGKQPNRDGSGTIGIGNVNAVLHDPYLKQKYIDSYIKDKISHIENDMYEMPHTSHAIEHAHKQNVSLMANERHIQAIHESNENHIQREEDHHHLNQKIVDESAKEEVVNIMGKNAINLDNDQKKANAEYEKAKNIHDKTRANYQRENLLVTPLMGPRDFELDDDKGKNDE